MSISIPDKRAKGIKPSKATRVFTRQATGVSQLDRRPGPGVRRIVVDRGQVQNSNAPARPKPIKSFALEEPVRRRLHDLRAGRRYAVR